MLGDFLKGFRERIALKQQKDGQNGDPEHISTKLAINPNAEAPKPENVAPQPEMTTQSNDPTARKFAKIRKILGKPNF